VKPLRRGDQALGLRRVAIDDRRSSRLEAGEDFSLGVGDRLNRAEIFDMHRRDGRDECDMRPRHPHERRDLAGVIHADLDHRVTRRRREARQRQRHAPMIVVGRGGSVRLAARREREAQHLLDTRLADRAGHSDDFRLRARPRSNAEALHPAHRFVDGEDRAERRKRLGAVRADQRSSGAGFEGAGDMVVAVMDLALDRNEEIAGLERARVDRHAADRPGESSARRDAERVDEFGFGPKRAHAASARAARASSASLNGSVRPPTI
jgi:hypothetical protein